jgi:photosystem II stability/assembly factor-like uncharacterized protein
MKATRLLISLAALASSSAFAIDNAPPPPVPAALDRPALLSAKATHSTILALARAGDRLVAAGERGIILFSDDHGTHWQQAASPTSATLTALRFVDASHGWAVGHMGIVLVTADGGTTWKKQFDGVAAARAAQQSAESRNDDKAAQRALYLVTDGPDKPFFDILMTSSSEGFIVGAYNLAFRTADGGKTWLDWSHRLDNPKGLHLYGMARSGNALYIAGEQGLILRSTDGGQTFSQIPSPYQGTWFGAIDTPHGLVLYGLRGNAYQLPHQGNAWQKLDTGSAAAISGATLLSNSRLVLASQSGELLVESEPGKFTPAPFRSATPLTAAIEAGNRQLLGSSMRGIVASSMSANN